MASVNRVLIVGASGVVGTAATEHFTQMPDWEVFALSRRRPVITESVRIEHASVDLHDRVACTAFVGAAPPITHLIYAAVSEAPGLAGGWRDETLMAANSAMLANILEPLARAGALKHVTLLQGAKAYGAHVHPVNVPLREDSLRDPHPNFYWLHEDLLCDIAAQNGFGFTIFRPQIVMGWAPGAAMNPIAAIGVYAALCRERGLSFALPGKSEALWEVTDACLLAEAMAWASNEPTASGETFNVTNGDVFVLRHAWPKLAKRLRLSSEGVAPTDFCSFFSAPQSQEAWTALAGRHGLAEPSLDKVLGQSATYLDLLLAPRIADKANPVLLSTIKLRQAGFTGCRDSLESLITQLRKMGDLRLVPSLLD